MHWLKSAFREVKTRWHQVASRRSVAWHTDAPIVSVSFDDVPLSAYRNGLPVLDAFGAKATFYVCTGLEQGRKRAFLGAHEIGALDQQGHEIGCHSFTHYRLDLGSAVGLAADACVNRREIARLTNGKWPRGFAFPFGDLSFASKRRLEPHYDCLRSVRPGVNRGSIDFNCLRAVPLERGSDAKAAVNRTLDDLERRPGWMITYTHGISDRPGNFDVSPETLAHLLEECQRRGIPVVPVAEVARAALDNHPEHRRTA